MRELSSSTITINSTVTIIMMVDIAITTVAYGINTTANTTNITTSCSGTTTINGSCSCRIKSLAGLTVIRYSLQYAAAH